MQKLQGVVIPFSGQLYKTDEILKQLIATQKENGYKIRYKKKICDQDNGLGHIFDNEIVLREDMDNYAKLKTLFQILVYENFGWKNHIGYAHVIENPKRKSLDEKIAEFTLAILSTLESQSPQRGDTFGKVN